MPRSLWLLACCTLLACLPLVAVPGPVASSGSALGSDRTAPDLPTAHRAFDEGSFQRARELYEELLPALAGEERGRVLMRLAQCYEQLEQHAALLELTATGEHPPFPWDARLLRVVGRVQGLAPGSWEKTAPQQQALDRFAAGGASFDGEWIETAFELTRSIWSHWQYEFDRKQWEELHWKPDPEAIELPYEQWVEREGRRIDAARESRILALQDGILARTPNADAWARLLLERGLLRARVVGSAAWDPFAGPSIAELLERQPATPSSEREAEIAERLRTWHERVQAAQIDWRELLRRFPRHELADDALFLLAHCTERYQGNLVGAVVQYRQLLDRFPDSQWASNAAGRIVAITQEQLQLGASQPAAAGTAAVLDLAARNVPEVLCKLYRLDRPLDFIVPYERLLPTAFALADDAPHMAWSVPTGCTDDHKLRRIQVVVPTTAPGAYVLRVLGASSRAETLVLISDAALVLEVGAEEVLAWVTGAQSGAPLQGAEVLVRLDLRHPRASPRSTTMRLRTDVDGLARWRFPADFQPDVLRRGLQVSAAALAGDHPALLDATSQWSDGARKARWVWYLETDRPAYRPGQTVQFKVSLRRWDGEQYEPARHGERFLLRFQDPQDTIIYEQELATGLDGALVGSLTLSGQVTLGMVRLAVLDDSQELSTDDSSAFRVEEYRLPEFEVLVQGPDAPTLLGDALEIAVRGRFLSGDPVRAAQVRVEVTRSPFQLDFQPARRAPWFHPRNETLYWGRESVFSASGVLDADGSARFQVPTAAFPDELDSVYHVSAWVSDEAGREETGSRALPVTRTDRFVHLDPRLRVLAPGETLAVDVRVMTPEHDVVASSGTLEIARRMDREVSIDGATGSGTAVRTTWLPILTLPLETHHDHARHFTETIDALGHLRITYRTTDRRGTPIEGSTEIWVVGPGFTGRDYQLSGLAIVAAAEEFTLGETVRMAIVTEVDEAEILVLREGAGRLLEARVVRARGRVVQIEFPATEAETPNVFITALTIRNGVLHRAWQEILIPPVHRFLSGVLTTSQAEARPGAQVELELAVSDRHGRPVAGTFSLSLYDRAVHAIQGPLGLDPAEHFYGMKWEARLREAVSLTHVPQVRHQWLPGKDPARHRSHALPSLLVDWQYAFRYASLGHGPWLRDAAGPWGEAPLESAAAYARPPASRALTRGLEKGSRDGDSLTEQSLEAEDVVFLGQGEDGKPGTRPVEPRVRAQFEETALWQPRLTTGADGRVKSRATLPDSLTAWHGVARGITSDGRVMAARVELRTVKHVQARLAAPRFFRQGDEVVLTALVRSDLATPLAGEIELRYPGHLLALARRSDADAAPATHAQDRHEEAPASVRLPVEIPAHGETTVDLAFRVFGTGPVELTLLARTAVESDALTRVIPALPYGLERQLASAGVVLDGDGTNHGEWLFAVPELSDAASRQLDVTLTPSPAIALIESLPYLVQYPYGCVEQTLHRFVPAAVVANLLAATGVDLAEILPEKPASIPSGFWGHLEERPLELFRAEDLGRLIAEGQDRLTNMQNDDGSWGWWAGAPGDPSMTALVVDAYVTAREAGVDLQIESLQAGANWIRRHLLGRDLGAERAVYERVDLEEFALLGRALFRARRVLGSTDLDADTANSEQALLVDLGAQLFALRSELGAQGKALLASALEALQIPDDERPAVLLRNLVDHEVRRPAWGTTHYGTARGAITWYDAGVESTARVLEAFLAIDPADPRVPEMVRWLLENRQGSHHDSTRSTAIVAFALARYSRHSGELDPALQTEVWLDGRLLERFSITQADLFRRRYALTIPAAALEPGEHRLEIRRSGRGPLYWGAALSFFSREDPVPADGNRLALARGYHRMVDERAERIEHFLVNGRTEERLVPYWVRRKEPIADGTPLVPGERILVEIEVDSALACSYLMFVDPKPAGLETIDVRSGYLGGTFSYRELRDSQVLHFASRLPAGRSTLRYELRVERPGRFRALPATAEAMYLPHLRANSASTAHVVTLPRRDR